MLFSRPGFAAGEGRWRRWSVWPSLPDAPGQALLSKVATTLALSARGYHRTLRVARTIADLDGDGGVRRPHVAEALSFRRVWASAQVPPVVRNATVS